MKRVPILILLATLCAALPVSAGDSALTVYTVNYPLKYFAERIGGQHVTVHFPAPADVDPAYWIPGIAAISDYQQADLVLLNGAGYAKWIGKVSLPRSRLVDTSRPFRDRYIPIEGAVTHSHGPGGDHAHEGVAFTTWLDFSLAAEQAKAVANALQRKRPALKDTFESNLNALEQDLMELDRRLKRIVSASPMLPLVASHPVYDYLARRYGLNLKSLHLEPDEVPDHGHMAELKKLLETHPAKSMIWEGAPLPQVEEKITAEGLSTAVFSPCANTPENGGFMDVMQSNIDNLGKAFR